MSESLDRTLVVGGAGYVGSVLVKRLLREGNCVTVLDNLLYNNDLSLHDVIDHPKLTFINGDLRNIDDFSRSLTGIRNVVLLAALVGDPISKKYPDMAHSVNEEGAIALINNLNGKGIDKFVFLSTCSNYGLQDTDELTTETAELKPLSVYAKNKVAVEEYLLSQEQNLDYCFTILRCATAFGTSGRMRFDLTVSEFCREFTINGSFLIYDEDTWRPYCHVEDICKAIITVLSAKSELVNSEVFNVGSDSGNFTKKMVVEEILKHLPDAVAHYKEDGFDPRNYRVSFHKIQNTLGFSCDYKVEDVIPKLVFALSNGMFSDFEDRRNFYGNYEIII